MTTLVVPDYDEAIAFYTGKLGFALLEDSDLGNGKRWVVVGPEEGARLLLAKATDGEQAASIGKQAGGRVGFFLHTDDFHTTHGALLENGIAFEDAPREEPYGIVAVFTDPYGNRWDLIEEAKPA